ncbi:MAG: hypothetical protein HOJ31_10140 [Anaerolineae bacterium]|nr:hypothetical protein [Anaerolineae bacterium]
MNLSVTVGIGVRPAGQPSFVLAMKPSRPIPSALLRCSPWPLPLFLWAVTESNGILSHRSVTVLPLN